jgi:hypothetical protein
MVIFNSYVKLPEGKWPQISGLRSCLTMLHQLKRFQEAHDLIEPVSIF